MRSNLVAFNQTKCFWITFLSPTSKGSLASIRESFPSFGRIQSFFIFRETGMGWKKIIHLWLDIVYLYIYLLLLLSFPIHINITLLNLHFEYVNVIYKLCTFYPIDMETYYFISVLQKFLTFTHAFCCTCLISFLKKIGFKLHISNPNKIKE